MENIKPRCFYYLDLPRIPQINNSYAINWEDNQLIL